MRLRDIKSVYIGSTRLEPNIFYDFLRRKNMNRYTSGIGKTELSKVLVFYFVTHVSTFYTTISAKRMTASYGSVDQL